MKRFAIVGVVVAALAAPEAEACSCIEPPTRIASGYPGGQAPCNTHVWLVDVGKIEDIAIRDSVTGKHVAYDHRPFGAFLELIPKQRLAPNRRYEILDGGRLAFSFTTSNKHDKVAPVIDRARAELVVRGRNSCDIGKTPYLETSATIVATAASESLVFLAGWRTDARTPPDLGKPPTVAGTAYLDDVLGYRASFGQTSMCSRARPLAIDANELRYHWVLVDLAGNRSQPAFVDVDPTVRAKP